MVTCPPLTVVLKNFKTTIIDYGFMIIMTKNIFYGYYDKEYFKNNIKITILLKWVWIKNNFEITVTNCGFKDIFKTFKTIVTNGDFLYLKIKNKK